MAMRMAIVIIVCGVCLTGATHSLLSGEEDSQQQLKALYSRYVEEVRARDTSQPREEFRAFWEAQFTKAIAGTEGGGRFGFESWTS
jgi:hypothetical protein